ncbi:LOW QUALITY PROTEIN: WD repeat-containing protein 47 [Musca domestica]|uniref:LOW QUALITY PROTEIN: WD repeat-containing protein 47 n=1 Tax=Musca domestica TaxID=7370 RepID=A0A9J7D8B2_MUSDO|nr:LOW QUALITY PROTEIN: WD repeat-containing protein 47 [Musca domestica]
MEIGNKKPLCFVPINTLSDVQPIRCCSFSEDGLLYAVGSNSKTLRICLYPPQINNISKPTQTSVIFKRTKHHKGSIYCLSWSRDGQFIASGSNDKTIKIIKYSSENKQLEGRELELTMHDGTVRDLCFMNESSRREKVLVSGGAGDCKLYISDCGVLTPMQAVAGHSGHIYSLYSWENNMVVTGSQDKTVRFWDIRVPECINSVLPGSYYDAMGSPVTAVCVDPTGRLLVSGHEDASCVLHDIRRNRQIQCFQPHSADIRSIRFSPSAYYLLTCGYDNKIVLTDLQGNLTLSLPSVVVGEHSDKVISARWHPRDFSILTTSADKTAKLWAIPNI